MVACGGVNPTEAIAERKAAEQVVVSEWTDAVLSTVVEKVLAGGWTAGVRSKSGAGDVDPEREGL